MAQPIKKSPLTITGVRASTIALFEGTFASAVGLVIAILYALRATVSLSAQTGNVLAGLSFGLAAGIVSIILLPLIYFAFGWLIGYVHGWVFNAVLNASNGIVVYTDKE